jgi:penicillin-binding protein 1C
VSWPRRRWARTIAWSALGVAGVAAASAGVVLASTRVAMPSFDAVRAGWRPSETRLLDRHGEVIHEARTDPRVRRFGWTPLGETSPALATAVITSEDRRFHRHGGVDPLALAAAAAGRVTGGPPRGGSTITMQLAAALDPALRRAGGPRTLAQKWRQMRGAWALEAGWSKAEILEAYLNLAAFRGELQGVGAAAAVLFAKAAHGLDGAEAAVLAVLLRAPNAPTHAVARRAERLAPAVGADAAGAGAAAGRLAAGETGAGPRIALAPHAAARLLRAAAAPAAPGVRSTLDASAQRIAVEALHGQLAGIRDRRARDGAALVVDVRSGEVRAYVGSGGDLSSARWVDGVQAHRQAGSTLKPFLYAVALDQRLLTAASLLDDSPLEIAIPGRGLYRPQNYDERFRGIVSVRTAVASSLNIPAVRAQTLLGDDAFVTALREFGFDGLREAGEHYGPALALGAADVSLWELAGAYRALANGGVRSPLRMTPVGAGADGSARRVLGAGAAFLMADILADREARSATFGLSSPLATRFWTAVKTGTSRDMRDNWCVGFSREFVVAVWVGNFSGEPMWNVSGVTGAAPAWLEIMTRLHARTPAGPPPPAPPGIVRARVAFDRLEPPRAELFLVGTEPTAAAPAAGSSSEGPAGPPGRFTIAPARPRHRIVSPAAGTIVAIDPGIPGDRQRILFEARPGPDPVRWVLDGTDLGPASSPVLWTPRAGRHRLALVDEATREHDAVDFEVRGPRPGRPGVRGPR